MSVLGKRERGFREGWHWVALVVRLMKKMRKCLLTLTAWGCVGNKTRRSCYSIWKDRKERLYRDQQVC